jgi:pSer/pThr/pTyr-binding forkhead associated (FHA) protein
VVEGGPQIEDLGSLNGTYVNGRRIDAATRLSGGDSIKLGATVLEVEAARAAATIASPVQPAEPSAPLAVPGETAAPSEPFGTYKATAPPKRRWRGGVASRQLLPMLLSWAAVAGTAVALAIYFAQH